MSTVITEDCLPKDAPLQIIPDFTCSGDIYEGSPRNMDSVQAYRHYYQHTNTVQISDAIGTRGASSASKIYVTTAVEAMAVGHHPTQACRGISAILGRGDGLNTA